MAMVQQDAPAAGVLQLYGTAHKQSRPSMVHSHCMSDRERQHQITPTSDQMTAQIGLDGGCWTAGTMKAM